MRVVPGLSKTGTLIICPRMADGCAAAIGCSVLLPMAST